MSPYLDMAEGRGDGGGGDGVGGAGSSLGSWPLVGRSGVGRERVRATRSIQSCAPLSRCDGAADGHDRAEVGGHEGVETAGGLLLPVERSAPSDAQQSPAQPADLRAMLALSSLHAQGAWVPLREASSIVLRSGGRPAPRFGPMPPRGRLRARR